MNIDVLKKKTLLYHILKICTNGDPRKTADKKKTRSECISDQKIDIWFLCRLNHSMRMRERDSVSKTTYCVSKMTQHLQKSASSYTYLAIQCIKLNKTDKIFNAVIVRGGCPNGEIVPERMTNSKLRARFESKYRHQFWPCHSLRW